VTLPLHSRRTRSKRWFLPHRNPCHSFGPVHRGIRGYRAASGMPKVPCRDPPNVLESPETYSGRRLWLDQCLGHRFQTNPQHCDLYSYCNLCFRFVDLAELVSEKSVKEAGRLRAKIHSVAAGILDARDGTNSNSEEDSGANRKGEVTTNYTDLRGERSRGRSRAGT
jgi:hypothetical protein